MKHRKETKGYPLNVLSFFIYVHLSFKQTFVTKFN